MRVEQWTNDSLGVRLSFQWIDFGTQTLAWVSDSAAFSSLAAAVPLEPAPAVSTLVDGGASERQAAVAGRLGTCLLMHSPLPAWRISGLRSVALARSTS